MSTLQGTFNTAVQAMLAQSQAMQNISTNIANVATDGYKAQNSKFQTILGETDPQGSYFSVQSLDTRNVTTQGSMQSTGSTMDLAINGTGFFVTNTAADGTGTWQYTRDGSFQGQAVQLATTTNGVPDQGTYLTTTNGEYVYGYAANPDGTFSPTNSLSNLQPILINDDATVPAQQTANINLQANLPAGATATQSVGLPFIDQLGNSRTLTVQFTPNGSGTWTLGMSSTIGSNNQPVSVTFNPPTVAFNSAGTLASPTGGQFSVTVNDPEGPQTFNLNLANSTQYGGDSSITVENSSQDGYIAGQLQSTAFNSSGVLVGTYSNGETKNLYELPVATFESPDNLTEESGNMFIQSQGSGPPSISPVGNGTSPYGTSFVTGSLENSNVDLSDQFSKMIVTQQAYTSASKVFQTADEMTQAVRDLIN